MTATKQQSSASKVSVTIAPLTAFDRVERHGALVERHKITQVTEAQAKKLCADRDSDGHPMVARTSRKDS